MKRQGIEGFTFDSKAEEWAHWCRSVWVHDKPRTPELQRRHIRMALHYHTESGEFARHSPAQPQNTPEIGVGSGRGDNRALWGLLAVAIIALVCAAGMMGII